jgi:hypothetical protein
VQHLAKSRGIAFHSTAWRHTMGLGSEALIIRRFITSAARIGTSGWAGCWHYPTGRRSILRGFIC